MQNKHASFAYEFYAVRVAQVIGKISVIIDTFS